MSLLSWVAGLQCLGHCKRDVRVHLRHSISCSSFLDNVSWVIVSWLYCKASSHLLKASVKRANLFWLVIRPGFQRCLRRSLGYCSSKEPAVMLIRFLKSTGGDWFEYGYSSWLFLMHEQRCSSPGDFRGLHALLWKGLGVFLILKKQRLSHAPGSVGLTPFVVSGKMPKWLQWWGPAFCIWICCLYWKLASCLCFVCQIPCLKIHSKTSEVG